MSYKDLNVYQRAYQVAIDLHNFLEKSGDKFTTDEKNQFRSMSREIIGNIAEGYSQRTPKAKRFFNFKALDVLHRIMLDIDFLHDTKRIPADFYNTCYNEYEICAKMLYKFNQSILERAEAPKEEAVPNGRQAAVAA